MKLYLDFLDVGKRIRELEGAAPGPADLRGEERAARRDMALEVLVKVGFIEKADWSVVMDPDVGTATYSFTKLRTDLLRKLARAVRVRTDEDRLGRNVYWPRSRP